MTGVLIHTCSSLHAHWHIYAVWYAPNMCKHRVLLKYMTTFWGHILYTNNNKKCLYKHGSVDTAVELGPLYIRRRVNTLNCKFIHRKELILSPILWLLRMLVSKSHCATLGGHVTCSSRLLECPHKGLKKRKDCKKTEDNGEFSHRLIEKANGTRQRRKSGVTGWPKFKTWHSEILCLLQETETVKNWMFDIACTLKLHWNPKYSFIIWCCGERYNCLDLSSQNYEIMLMEKIF
jgi:hypothetical protein